MGVVGYIFPTQVALTVAHHRVLNSPYVDLLRPT